MRFVCVYTAYSMLVCCRCCQLTVVRACMFRTAYIITIVCMLVGMLVTRLAIERKVNRSIQHSATRNSKTEMFSRRGAV